MGSALVETFQRVCTLVCTSHRHSYDSNQRGAQAKFKFLHPVCRTFGSSSLLGSLSSHPLFLWEAGRSFSEMAIRKTPVHWLGTLTTVNTITSEITVIIQQSPLICGFTFWSLFTWEQPQFRWKQMILLLMDHQKVKGSLMLHHDAHVIHLDCSHHMGITRRVTTAQWDILRETTFT